MPPVEDRPLPGYARVLIALALVAFLALQIPVLFGADGIMARHGFWNGFSAFNAIMLSDPVTTAGLIDLSFLLLVFIVILANGLPRGPAYPFLLAGFVIAAIVYPGLAALGFLLLYWRRIGQFRP